MTERPQNKLIFLQFKHRKGHETLKKAKKKTKQKTPRLAHIDEKTTQL